MSASLDPVPIDHALTGTIRLSRLASPIPPGSALTVSVIGVAPGSRAQPNADATNTVTVPLDF